RVLRPQSTSLIAWMTFLRASTLSSGATLSSRSRLITSAADFAIFSKSSGRDPGPKSWQRFGRAGGCGWTVKLMRSSLTLLLHWRDRVRTHEVQTGQWSYPRRPATGDPQRPRQAVLPPP